MWANVTPVALARCVAPRLQDLEAAEYAAKEGNTAHVGVTEERAASVAMRLRRVADQAQQRARGARGAHACRERTGGQAKVRVEDNEDALQNTIRFA